MESIVQQTILFAQQKGNENFPFCVEDLQAFLGLNIAMGLLRLPRISDYWSKCQILSTPFFPSIMSRDRFMDILRYLHLKDSRQQKKYGEEGYDPLYKVKPLVDHLVAVFPSVYQPEQHLSIDEMMIGTRCRISFLKYIPKKTNKIWDKGLGVGYVLNFQVYTGSARKSKGEKKEKDVSFKVVNDLMQMYEGKIIFLTLTIIIPAWLKCFHKECTVLVQFVLTVLTFLKI